MLFKKIPHLLWPLGALAALWLAYRHMAWLGVALVLGGLVMWVLLHFTRMMHILKRAANRPLGYVDSAVMLNAKLRAGVPLVHVIALTRALGELLSPADTQPERFRWTDGSDSSVTCEFVGGKLQSWQLHRPVQSEPSQEPAGEASKQPSLAP